MILLDTHVWLWLLHDPTQLSSQAQALVDLEEPQNGLLVSAISVWEIAVKSSIGKLKLPLPIDEWYNLAQAHSGIVIEPLSPLDAIASTQLPDSFHKDPADRILVAIARRYGIPLYPNTVELRLIGRNFRLCRDAKFEPCRRVSRRRRLVSPVLKEGFPP